MNLTECLQHHKTSQTALADLLGVTQSAVSQWIERGIVPAEHCPRIEKHFNGMILCEDMNDKVDWAYLRESTRAQSEAENPIPDAEKARESLGPVGRQPVSAKGVMS